MGGAIGLAVTVVANPILYRHGILANWRPGMDVIDTAFINNIDVYLSFGIGLTFAITLISLGNALRPAIRALRKHMGRRKALDGSLAVDRQPGAWRKLFINNPKRGDFSIFIALGIYATTCATWIGISAWLIDGFPWRFFIGYAIFFTPVISYATAKLEGLVGQAVSIPMIREATYILSGYRGVQIWFTPIPYPDYGRATVSFRILELTGTKIKSKVKTQLVTIPVIIIASLIFSQLLWSMAPVPSDVYPFAQKMWDLMAKNMCLTYSSTMEGGSLFFEAFKLNVVGWGLGAGVVTYVLLTLLGLPTLLVFGVVRGLGQTTPAGIPLEFIGALLGRFYFRKRFGDRWMKFTPVMLAGYACGMGLVAMVGMAFAILNRMMSPLIF
ncbi:MAG: peptide transporter, partial [Lentisphaerae bacterium]|nr:peptide transporter [Lentisphaerota bacterium]